MARQTALASGLISRKQRFKAKAGESYRYGADETKTEEINQLAKSMQENKGDAAFMEKPI